MDSRLPETQAQLGPWPGDADVAVALTFDVDAESAWLAEGPQYERRLTTLSQAGFGPARGLRRILHLLDHHGIRATFYVPGHTADHNPSPVAEILAHGHEVAHHGYLHLRTDELDADGQRAELERGLDALGRLGVEPAGYRSPSWEITPETAALLSEMGFRYDSSMMRDDRPYWYVSEGRPLLEVPVHWSLDDWPYFGWTPYEGGLLADPQAVERIWLEEFTAARSDNRLVTYTMHPEVIGRGYCMRMLERVIAAMHDQGRPWFATHSEIADLAGSSPAGSRLTMHEAGGIAAVASARLFVNGTLMRGEPLHGNLAGAAFRGTARTAPHYRLLSVGDVHPAMISATAGEGIAVAGELYDMPLSQLQSVLAHEPPGLGLGVVDLEDGLQSLGICWTAPDPPAHSVDISAHGGWREYRTARRSAAAPQQPQ